MPQLPIGQKPYFNIDPVSKGLTISDSCIDAYIDESGTVRRRLGYELFTDTATGQKGNGIFYWEQLDCLIVVTGGKCFRIAKDGTKTDISGSVAFGADIVFAAGNKEDGSAWLYIADGGYPIYTTGGDCARLTAASGSYSEVSWVTYIESKFVIGKAGSRQFVASSYNPSTGFIEPDYFVDLDSEAAAVQSADNTVTAFATYDEMWVWGTQSLEVWRADDIAFSPIDGASSPVGLLAKHSIATADNTVYALALVDGNTKRAVVKYVGRSPQVVSLPIERVINSYDVVDDAIGFLVGDSQYVITFPTEGVTWCYSYLKDQWSQWSYWNVSQGMRELFKGQFSAGAWGNIYMQSRVSGEVYRLSNTLYQDAGEMMRSEYVTGLIQWDTSDKKRCNKIMLRVKCGSTDSYVSEPKLMVRWRDNGNAEWKRETMVGLGLQGNREVLKGIYRCGTYDTRQWSFIVTDNVDLALVSIEEDVEKNRV